MNLDSISIMCDQKDCIYNVAHTVHHDHPNDACMHSHPAIQRYGEFPNWVGLFCNSKERDMTDPSTHKKVDKGYPLI
jgi:hypothetical protein